MAVPWAVRSHSAGATTIRQIVQLAVFSKCSVQQVSTFQQPDHTAPSVPIKESAGSPPNEKGG